MIKIENKEKCSGCGACRNVCPTAALSMKQDPEGFFYPSIDESKCIECHLCEKVCPCLHEKTEVLDSLPPCFLVWSKDPVERNTATSGGLFTAVASAALKKGWWVSGAVYDEKHVVHHILTNRLEDLPRITRSKYVQSQTDLVYRQIGEKLKQKENVLFCGTPCQVYGLLSYLEIKRISQETLVTMDVVCHGAPSPKVFREYLHWHENVQNSPVAVVAMREKVHPKSFYTDSSTKIVFENGTVYQKAAGLDYYGRTFWGEISSRPSCYHCPFKTVGRLSDMTIGDCWFSKQLSYEHDICYDVTLCVLHKESSQNILQMGNINYISVDSEKAIKCNGGMIYKSATMNPSREEFFQNLGTVPFNELVENYFPTQKKKKNVISVLKAIIKLVPGVYKKYYFSEKKKEFLRRCQREIPDSAKVTRII